MTTNIQTTDQKQAALTLAIEQAVTAGDLSKLNPEQRLFYYKQVCGSAGLNPLTRPLDFIQLNGKLVLYVKKDGTDQLRKINQVSITKLEREIVGEKGFETLIVTAHARDKNGKEDCDVGAVPLPATGEARSNAIMKGITKAKRRVTLSISGMGLLDESEIESIPGTKEEPIDLSGNVAAKAEEKTKSLRNKLGAITPAKAEAVEAPATPPPPPAAATSAPKEPEVLPKQEKPAQKAAAKPEPTDAEMVVQDLGELKVAVGPHSNRKLKDLKDEDLRKTDAALRDLPDHGPRIKSFAAAFHDYCEAKGVNLAASETPPPAPKAAPAPAKKDELEEFFSTPSEEGLTPFQKEERRVFQAMRNAKTVDELKVAWADLNKAARGPILQVDKMPPDQGRAWVNAATALRDECKKNFAK